MEAATETSVEEIMHIFSKCNPGSRSDMIEAQTRIKSIVDNIVIYSVRREMMNLYVKTIGESKITESYKTLTAFILRHIKAYDRK